MTTEGRENASPPPPSASGEREPLTERRHDGTSPVPQFVVDKESVHDVPGDRLNLVLLVMTLHGIGTLIAWNVFITIAPMYFRDYKLARATAPENPGYVRNFLNYVCICSQLPNLTVNAIGLFVDKGNLFLRIVISLCVVVLACVFTIVFVFVDTSAWPFGFFLLTMATVIVLNAANGFYQNSIYGLVGSFPFKYINAVVLGNNICGLSVTLLFILTTQFFPDPAWNAAVYFSITLLALLLCIGSFFYLRSNAFYSYQMAVEKRASQDRGVYSLRDYLATFRDFWLPLLNVWSVFFVTLLLFPSVLADIKLYPLARNDPDRFDSVFPHNLFVTIFVFLNFNFFSVVGSKLADFVRWPSPKYVVAPILLRFAFIPLFFLSNYLPGGHRDVAVLVTNEWVVFVLIALFAMSHGYYSSVAMMYAPAGADPSTARIIGKMSAFFLVFGIACGIACSFLAEYAVRH